MKKLRFVSMIILFLLFCPFIKQCDGINKTVEGSKQNYFNELKIYFTEKSENVFDLSFQLSTLFDKNKRKDFDYKTDSIALVISMIFSTLLIVSSIIGAIRLLINKLKHTSWFYILNICFILLIVISNMFVWLDRIGQIKFGFYLLLLSNLYMLHLLKKEKEQIQL